MKELKANRFLEILKNSDAVHYNSTSEYKTWVEKVKSILSGREDLNLRAFSSLKDFKDEDALKHFFRDASEQARIRCLYCLYTDIDTYVEQGKDNKALNPKAKRWHFDKHNIVGLIISIGLMIVALIIVSLPSDPDKDTTFFVAESVKDILGYLIVSGGAGGTITCLANARCRKNRDLFVVGLISTAFGFVGIVVTLMFTVFRWFGEATSLWSIVLEIIFTGVTFAGLVSFVLHKRQKTTDVK